jgi:hypothetical protein
MACECGGAFVFQGLISILDTKWKLQKYHEKTWKAALCDKKFTVFGIIQVIASV